MVITESQTQNTINPVLYIPLDNDIDTDTKVSPDFLYSLTKQVKESTSYNQSQSDIFALSISKPKEDLDFILEFEDLDFQFKLQIIHIEWSVESDEIALFLDLAGVVLIKASLIGYWDNENDPTFKLQSFGLKLEEKREIPLSFFLSSTLWAILGLSNKFRIFIPQLKYDFHTQFELPIKEIKVLLQERRLAYRLLVIEFALNISLPFPNGFIKGEDVEAIAFCYHAIVDREFDWFATSNITIPWEANEENLALLPETNEIESLKFRPEFITKNIFGFEVGLGLVMGVFNHFVIDNYDEVKEKLSKLDGKIVELKCRSLDGKSRLVSVRVPTFTLGNWKPFFQNLVKIETSLNKTLVDRYFDLASSTLEGLTELQKESITTRPKMTKLPRISQ